MANGGVAGNGTVDAGTTTLLPRISVGRLLLQSGPRLVRDSIAPVAVFYLLYRLTGNQLLPGVAGGTVVAVGLYFYETSRGRSGVLARLALGFVLLQAAIGFLTRSAQLYFAQPVILDLVLGGVFIGSVALRRPIVGATARDAYPFPPQVTESATFRRVFGTLSLIWGGYFWLRSVVRLAGVMTGKVDTMIIVNAVTDVPFVIALIAFSTWYGVHGFRRSEEWGPLIAMVEAGAGAAATIGSEPAV
jgi:hypothetical protein